MQSQIEKSHYKSIVNPFLQQTKQELEKELKYLQSLKGDYQEISNYLNSYIQINNQATEDMVVNLVNKALRAIFSDKNIQVKLNKNINWSKVIYSLSIIEDGVEGDINSFGGGVLAVIAVVMKIIFVLKTSAYPMLVLDESLGFVSVEYQPTLSQFLSEVSKEMGVTIILISHQPQVVERADIVLEL